MQYPYIFKFNSEQVVKMSTREYCLIYHRILISKIMMSVWQTVQRSDI